MAWHGVVYGFFFFHLVVIFGQVRRTYSDGKQAWVLDYLITQRVCWSISYVRSNTNLLMDMSLPAFLDERNNTNLLVEKGHTIHGSLRIILGRHHQVWTTEYLYPTRIRPE
ncbi:hypothetical protein V8F33_003933 [Rhypophila sp. PSN 637]